MTEPVPRPPVRRGWWKYLLALVGAGFFLALLFAWYITTESFQALVRRRIVAEVERITGGRAEVGAIHTIPYRMQVDLRDLTIHGREAAGEIPLAHVDRLVARIKVISLLRTEFGFHDVVLDHPTFHVLFYPDGTTNVPSPPAPRAGAKTTIETLFALSINRLEVRHGQATWDDQKIPLDFAVSGAALDMEYSFLRRRYDGRLLLGKVDGKFQDSRPFAWTAALEFGLGSSFAEIKSLKVSSGRSNLEATGRMSDFRHPQVEASYTGQLDLAEVSGVARRRDLREGLLQVKGQGQWSRERFAASGSATLRDFGWQDETVEIRRANAAADFTVSDQQIKLTKVQGRALSGTFAGDAEITHWLPEMQSPAEKSGKTSGAKKPEEQVGAIRLRLRDVGADDVASALNSKAHPIVAHLAGLTAGTLDIHWRGSWRDAEVGFALNVTPPAQRVPGQLPMTARAEGTYRASTDVLALTQLHLSTPATRLQAAGTLSSSSALKLLVTTSDLHEWRPVIAAFHGPVSLPFDLHGSATFNGIASGGLSNPSLAGTLQANDFDVLLPATGQTTAEPVHWDSLSTTLQISSHAAALHNGALARGSTTANFDVTAVLQHGKFTDTSAFTARLSLRNVDIAGVQAFAGYRYPVTGNADLTVQASGTRADPHAEGQIHLTNGTVYGEPVSLLDASVRLSQDEAGLSGIHLVHYDSVITGYASYKASTRAFSVELSGSNFNLVQIRQLQAGRFAVEGRADFTLRGSGTQQAPVLHSSIQVRDLSLDHERAGNLEIEASTTSGELHLTGHSQFEHGTLQVDGTVQMRENYPANISLRFDHLDIDPFLRRYLSGPVTGHSAVAGTLQMRGPLRDPRQWVLNGNLTDAFLDVEYAKVHNQDPIRFSLTQEVVHVEQLHLVGDGTDLTAHGSVQLTGRRELDITADGRLDLKLLNGINPDFTASGLMSVTMTVNGTTSNPLPQGRMQLTNGSLAYAGLPSGLNELNGVLVFSRERLHVESLTGRTGGGRIELKGDATSYNHQTNFNLTATGNEVRLRYPPGVSSTANVDVHWVGTPSASVLSGDVTVTKLAVTPGFDFGSYLERSRQISAITPANSPLYNVKLDMHLQTAPELQMKTALARLSGDADLRLRGSIAHPALLGRADILEGEATFNGTKFRLERGDITFASPVAIVPTVNLEATTHVRDYDLDLTVTGTPDRLAINYRSEPPLPQSDIIALLALGRTSEESEQLQQQSGQSAFTDEASALILNQALNATVSSRIQRLFGVSRIKIDPQGLTTETNPTARGPQVTIEQQFANNLTLTYSTNVSQSAQQIIQGEYYFTRNVSVVGTRDQNGVVSFDVRIRRRKK